MNVLKIGKGSIWMGHIPGLGCMTQHLETPLGTTLPYESDSDLMTHLISPVKFLSPDM